MTLAIVPHVSQFECASKGSEGDLRKKEEKVTASAFGVVNSELSLRNSVGNKESCVCVFSVDSLLCDQIA